MAKLTFVKRIVNEKVINSFNLVLNVLFGGKLPELYDEHKVYNKGDCIIFMQDGVYKIGVINKDGVTGPFSKEFVDEIIFTNLFKDSTLLTQNDITIQSKQQAITDDLSTLVCELAGMLDNNLQLNTLYRENFKSSDFLNISLGMHIPGCVKAIPGQGIDFQLKNPVELKIKPSVFKVKHMIELLGIPNTLGCEITFNALDSDPYWFSANDALLSANFFEIPADKFIKEDDKPYAMNIRLFSDCNIDSSIVVSELMVVYN